MSASSALGTDRVPPRTVTNKQVNSVINSSESVAFELQKAKSENSIVSQLTGFGEVTQENCLEKLFIR